MISRNILILGIIMIACRSGPTSRELAVSVLQRADTTYLDLSESLYTIARGGANARQLQMDVTFGGDPTSGLTHVGDVTTTSDGRVVVLDRGANEIVFFGKDGQRKSSFGREGEGPGEYDGPIAMASVGDHLVVLQPQTSRSLTVVRHDGEVRTILSEPVAGDWRTMVLRGPHDMIEAPFGGGVNEDWTRRIRPLTDSTFVYQVQSDELQTERRVPEISLVLFDLDGLLLDTIWTTTGPRLYEGAPVVENQLSRYEEPLFSQRPVWTAGDGWLAFSAAGDSTLTVRSNRDSSLVIVRWPLADMPITDDDRLTRARWSGEYTLKTTPGARGVAEAMSSSQREREYRLHAGRLPFAEHAPELMAAWGVHDCVIVSGFEPRDYVDGTSLTLVVLNVRSHELMGVLRLANKDRRIRHVSIHGVFATHRDDFGVFSIERYPFPYRESCG